jgi:hypothetical protein
MHSATRPDYPSSTFSQAGYPVVTIESVCAAGGCSSTLNQTWFVTQGETNGEQRYILIPQINNYSESLKMNKKVF